MAVFNFTFDLLNIYPNGTVLYLYIAREQPSGANGPVGNSVQSQTMTAGSVTFTNLTEGESYVVWGQVNGTWVRSYFKVQPREQTVLHAEDDATVIGNWTFTGTITGLVASTIVDAKGDLLAGTAADTLGRLAVGANGTVLTADSNETTGIKWSAAGAAISPTIVDAKGDLIVASAADTVARFGVGADGAVLMAEAAQTLGVKWATNVALKNADNAFSTVQSIAMGGASDFLKLNRTGDANWKIAVNFMDDGTKKFSLGTDLAGNGTNDFWIYDEVAAASRMTISSSGVANFPAGLQKAGVDVATTADITKVDANTQTGNYTLALSDAGKCVELNSASNFTITIPTNASVAFPVGTVIEVHRYGAGTVTVAPDTGVTMRNPAAAATLRAQYSTAALRKRGTDEWVLSGDLG